jgi:hypothetical protein
MRHHQDIPRSSWCGGGLVHRLPLWLPQSAQVDLRQLYLGGRSAIRLHLLQRVAKEEVHRFARRHGWFAVLDDEGFVVLSANPARARWIMALDRSMGVHTHALGLALGYPPCCCRAAAVLGEAHLDRWAMHLIDSRFVGRFRLTSPKDYRGGNAWLSHIPCSTRCERSLHMVGALAAAPSIKRATGKYARARALAGGTLQLASAIHGSASCRAASWAMNSSSKIISAPQACADVKASFLLSSDVKIRPPGL